MRVDHDREAEVRRQTLGDGAPGVAVVVGTQHADVGAPAAGPVPFAPAAVVLHVEPAWRVGMAGDLVNALAELGIRIGSEAGADALIARREGFDAVLPPVVAASRDAEVDPLAVAHNRVGAETAVAGLPFAGVLVVADALHHLPGVAAVVAAKQRRRLDTGPDLLLAVARFERP